tara:strand:- start:422 stop:1240 length:819 start_codon:yes stop_codon:yes gene_type:complete
MTKIKMYCLTLNPNHLELIKKLDYNPVGLGEINFHGNEWFVDNTKNNIASKNKYYGEYTFHYWLWKNNILDANKWVGFCQYRKFWKKNKIKFDDSNFDTLNKCVLKKIPKELENYETILGEELFVNEVKISKLFKHSFKKIIIDPTILFDKKKRNIKFHFDMMHGDGNLNKAISLLDSKEKKDFDYFVNTEISFNPHNMFICKNKDILFSYYNSLFPWLERCQKIFGFEQKNVYGLKRIYAFLAERYMSYWFKKYTKYTLLPIHFKDISSYL